MSNDIKFNFLSSDEEERYQKHLSLKEIGYEGQRRLKKSSVPVSYTHLTLPTNDQV